MLIVYVFWEIICYYGGCLKFEILLIDVDFWGIKVKDVKIC